MGHGRVLRQGQVLHGFAASTTTKSSKSIPTRNWPQESRSRLEQIKSEPDNPTDPFQWLVNLFPESKREGPVLPKNAGRHGHGQSVDRSTIARLTTWRMSTSSQLGTMRLRRGPRPAMISRRSALARMAALLGAGCAVAVGGCAGYRFGAASLYPPDIQTVYVPMFESNSFRRNSERAADRGGLQGNRDKHALQSRGHAARPTAC